MSPESSSNVGRLPYVRTKADVAFLSARIRGLSSVASCLAFVIRASLSISAASDGVMIPKLRSIPDRGMKESGV